jgi:NADH-quinone oxidoreductase subunit C
VTTPPDTAVALQERFGEAVEDVAHFRGETTAVVKKSSLIEACRYLHDDLGYDVLSDLTCVDWLDRKPRFDVVYHLTSLRGIRDAPIGSATSGGVVRFRLKVQVEENESVPSVIPIWLAANWAEREVWDLFGVSFEGHPDLRRIQMPEGWIGHPLRKDYAQTQITLPRPKTDKTYKGR